MHLMPKYICHFSILAFICFVYILKHIETNYYVIFVKVCLIISQINSFSTELYLKLSMQMTLVMAKLALEYPTDTKFSRIVQKRFFPLRIFINAWSDLDITECARTFRSHFLQCSKSPFE